MKKAAKASGAEEGLFARRLLVVAGKGGVGKTTIACALGLVASRLGKRTLVAEVDGVGRASLLLGAAPQALGEAHEVRPGLFVMSVDGSTALQEYLALIVPIKRLLNAVFSSRIYQYFVAAAPGLKELMTIGKIWYEAERKDEASGGRLWDLVILDAPATGHGMQYLGMPIAAHEVFGSGLVGRESQRLVDLLTDPIRTALVLATTAEEMPVNETIEMYEKVTRDLHIPLGPLVVNRLHRTDLQAADIELLRAGIRSQGETLQGVLLEEVAQRAEEELGWAEINRLYLQRLSQEVAAEIVELPFLFAEEFGKEEIRNIADLLEAKLVVHESKKAQRSRA